MDNQKEQIIKLNNKESQNHKKRIKKLKEVIK